MERTNPASEPYPAAGLYARIADLEAALHKTHAYSVALTSDPALSTVARDSALRIGGLAEKALCTCDKHPDVLFHGILCRFRAGA
jgi:hypothetical protein